MRCTTCEAVTSNDHSAIKRLPFCGYAIAYTEISVLVRKKATVEQTSRDDDNDGAHTVRLRIS